MNQSTIDGFREVALPWSDGTLSARLWRSRGRVVVGVPELGLHCYGATEPEAVFRLFTSLLKYYRQLRTYKTRLGEKGLEHLNLLRGWVESIEDRMKAPSIDNRVVAMSRSRR
ncbi:MAG: hypothetical protein IT343_13640 [Candidatus Melainabacteria bacterium]|jgi:hypothetical protein|nr:hypothetical protein [Candidatus Melainabacteria bacterium]